MAEGYSLISERKRGKFYFKLYLDTVNHKFVIASEDNIKPGFIEFNEREDACFRGKASVFNYFTDNIEACKYFWKKHFGNLDGFHIDYTLPSEE